jgi:ABC-type nitrate/sulfonate/bicarbonate transport system ATPase subunit/ABC-type transporter Mla maintaining outer membrane lipid asymmetry permease subunit MlaE
MLLRVRELNLSLPNGTVLFEDVDLEVGPGEIVALLGPSGAGKSTLARAVLDPRALRAQGYEVSWSERELEVEAAFVPQRGALLDHLDVAANLVLASPVRRRSVAAEWLERFELDEGLAKRGRSVARLSGGQAQRIAVARALAAGRRLLVLDEPSVGLDPWAVKRLAELLVELARSEQAALLLITHDLTLAAAADRVLLLDPSGRKVETLSWERSATIDAGAAAALEEAIGDRLRRVAAQAGAEGRRRLRFSPFAPLRALGSAVLRSFEPRLWWESLKVLRVTLAQSLWRPLSFYAAVALLLGITVPYVVVHISSALRPQVMLGMIGGSYILALAPPLSAIVFAATSGSAVSAWLGGLGVRGQVLALEGLGVSPARYLWSPAWWALVLGYLVTAVVFTAAMVTGGWLLFNRYGVPHAYARLTADFLAPAPERVVFLWRGIWLVVCYALAVASIVVAQGSAPKERMDEVTNAMTSGVMRTTLFVALVELGSIALVYARQPGAL